MDAPEVEKKCGNCRNFYCKRDELPCANCTRNHDIDATPMFDVWTAHKPMLEVVDGEFKPRTRALTLTKSDNFPVSPKKGAFSQQVGGGHYKKMAIQPLEYIMANNIPFPEGNVIKYVSRWRDKNGLEDLKKSRDMLDKIIEAVEAGNYK